MGRESILIFVCMLFVCIAFGQEAGTSLNEYLERIGNISTIFAGALSMALSEILNNYLGAKKTNALLVSLSVAIGISVTLITLGVPNVGIASVFTISSGLFAVWRKVQVAIKR